MIPVKPLFHVVEHDNSTGLKIIDLFLRDNPHLKRGERMRAPVGVVYDGMFVGEPEWEHLQPQTTIAAMTKKIDLENIESENFASEEFKDKKYIHYYTCSTIHSAIKVGGKTYEIDPYTFDKVEHIATQEDVDRRNMIKIRFGFS